MPRWRPCRVSTGRRPGSAVACAARERAVEGVSGLASIASFRDGWFTAQDEGSQVVAYAVDPRPGETVWDMCSAPGTKTTHMAELMGDEGRIVAVDIPRSGCALWMRCKRSDWLGPHRSGRAEPVGPPGSADKVLVDAPCSGTGVLGRRPDLRWHRRESDFDELIQLQRSILLGSSALVKSGGVLVYSTCSVDMEENLGNVRWFLRECPDFRLDSLESVLPASLLATFTPERMETCAQAMCSCGPI